MRGYCPLGKVGKTKAKIETGGTRPIRRPMAYGIALPASIHSFVSPATE
jgi:hypothetical protein